MRAIEIDFARSAPRRSSTGLLALLVAGALALGALALHSELEMEASRLDARLGQLEPGAARNAQLPVRVDEAVQSRIRQANDVIDRLALPWDRLFRAVEGAATPRIVLLGISPDARTGSVQITGEAPDSPALFDYVQRLQRQAEFANVFLLQHQREERRPGQPLRFVAVGTWTEPQRR